MAPATNETTEPDFQNSYANSEYHATVARLSKLEPAAYDRVRKAESLRLGVRTATLDHDVDKARPAPSTTGEPSPGKGRALGLVDPEPWPDPVDGVELIGDLVRQISRYVILSDHAAIGAALWALHAHAHDAAFHSPRLTLTSPTMRCGKSTMLRTIGRLIPRPLPTANITPAAMFRVVEAAKPSLLIDEADSFAQENEELRGCINSSHCRLDAYVIRAVPAGDDYEARRFSTWAPMAIASIGRMASTIADRSIMISMERKAPGQTVARMRADRDDGFGELARKAARWVADHLEVLRSADPDVPRVLNDRAADNWRPLLAIADLAGGNWHDHARAAALALSTIDEDADTLGVQLLADIKTVFERTKAEAVWTEDLLRHLHAMSEAPWSEYGRQRKPISPRQLAALLKPFGIGTKGQVWNPSTRENKRGYMREQFSAAWGRYLSANVLDATESAAESDFLCASDDEPLAHENPPKPTAAANSSTLAHGSGGPGPERGEHGGTTFTRSAVEARAHAGGRGLSDSSRLASEGGSPPGALGLRSDLRPGSDTDAVEPPGGEGRDEAPPLTPAGDERERIGSCAYCRDAAYGDDAGPLSGDRILHYRCTALWLGSQPK
jgi:putative DNA primase/helicase